VLRASAETAIDLERSTSHLRQSRLPRGASAKAMRDLEGLCRQTELLEASVQQAECMTQQVDALLGRAEGHPDNATHRYRRPRPAASPSELLAGLSGVPPWGAWPRPQPQPNDWQSA
jgi:hypothetical protein